MAHGYGAVKEQALLRFADTFTDTFTEAGFAVLVHDHRTFGASDGTPRQEGVRWDNTVTVRSTRKARMCEPGVFIDRISPTPLLMIVGQQDTVTLTDTDLSAYNRALEPKQLHVWARQPRGLATAGRALLPRPGSAPRTPGRDSSDKPSRPRSRKRRRQVRTVSGAPRNRRDTSMIEWPSAHSSTIRDHCANAWAVVRRRTHPSSSARWASLSGNGGIFGPGRLIPN